MCRITGRRAVEHHYLICGCGQLSEKKDDPRIIKEAPASHHELQQTPAHRHVQISTSIFTRVCCQDTSSGCATHYIISWKLEHHLRNLADFHQNKSVSRCRVFVFLSAGTDGQQRPQSQCPKAFVCLLERLSQSGLGGAEEARNRARARGGRIGLYC